MTRRQLLLGGVTAGAAAALTASDRRPAGFDPRPRPRVVTPAVPPVTVASVEAPRAPNFVSRPDLRIPGVEVTVSKGRLSPGLILLAPYNAPTPAQAGAVIVDDRGVPVWQHPLTDLITANLRVQSYRGAPVLTWWQGDIELGHGVGSYVIADSAYAPIAHIDAGNGYQGDLHEFLLTDRGTALLTSYAVRSHDLRPVGGSADGTIQDAIFQEVEVASGRVLFEWHSLDHIPITESYWPVGTDWDYVHLNSIGVDSDRNLLVSARNTHTIYKINRASGEIMWRLGGRSSDFAIAPDAGFAWQHDARRQPDGTISIFDNGYSVSRALVLAVDEPHRRVTLQRGYQHPNNVYALSQGNVEVLPNGHVFVGWGAQPYVSEFTSSGELIFDARLGSGYISYRAYRSPWTGAAAGSPAVAAQRTDGFTDVYVSWNGDAGVTRWHALAGTSATDLRPIGAVARTGFETGMRIPRAFTMLRLRGTSASGRTLTTTPATAI